MASKELKQAEGQLHTLRSMTAKLDPVEREKTDSVAAKLRAIVEAHETGACTVAFSMVMLEIAIRALKK